MSWRLLKEGEQQGEETKAELWLWVVKDRFEKRGNTA
jgi:hypothetical protein